MLKPPQRWVEGTALGKASLRGDFGADIQGGKGALQMSGEDVPGRGAPERDYVEEQRGCVGLERVSDGKGRRR